MAKVHELLAVDSNLKGQANKNRLDLQNTFDKKKQHFGEKLITVTALTEGALPETREQSAIQTTVRKEMAWISGFLSKAIDASFAIDIANTYAKADIVLEDETTLVKDVPATALLQLEKRVKELHELVGTIPTLDPTKGFKLDPAREAGIFVAREVVKDKTEKVEEFPIIVPATKEFPAQVAKVNRDVKIGIIRELEWSSLITPAMKADLLDRVEILLRAVTKARSRANDADIDVKLNKIGKKLLDYVFEPLNA